MLRVVHITPNHTPMFAVFVEDDGSIAFRPVVCWACMEQADTGIRVVAGVAIGNHPVPCDIEPNFVGYSMFENREPWVAKAKAQLQKMKDREAAAAKQKIIVPNQPGPKDLYTGN